MFDLSRRAYRGLAIFLAVLAVCLFLPALTLAWWQAWLYFALFAGATVAITTYFLKHDPRARRASDERRSYRREGAAAEAHSGNPRCHHPPSLHRARPAVLADIAVAASFRIIFGTFQESTFAASTIEIRAG